MRWAVVGSNGMFGKELVEMLLARGEDVFAFNRDNFDLEKSVDALADELAGSEIVVNAVAYTAVDKAESELFEASTVNGIYAGKLAQAAALANARFFHISTDYVFDGMSKVPYKISDRPTPRRSMANLNLLAKSWFETLARTSRYSERPGFMGCTVDAFLK